MHIFKLRFSPAICPGVGLKDHKGFPGGSVVNHLPAKQEMQIWSLGQEYPLDKEMATHSNILPQEIPWTEEPDGLRFMGWQDLDTTSNEIEANNAT